jgi:hypothetical protein
MIDYMFYSMSKVSESFSSFDRENLKGLSKSKVLVGFFSVLLLGGGAVVAASPDVSIGQNGIQINTGSLDMNGNDIQDAGTTIWDASAGNIATGVVDYTAATASDVGLGNVRNVDLSNTAGSYLTYDSNNDNFNVDTSFDTNADTECSGTDTYLSGAGTCETDDTGSGGDGYLPDDPATSNVDMSSEDIDNVDTIGGDSSGEVGFTDKIDMLGRDIEVDKLVSDSNWEVTVDDDGNEGGPYDCSISEIDGDFSCQGSKNWIHDLGNGSEAVYSSQESPEVRAVYEGKATVNKKETFELPSHFSKTVSDSKPMLRAQVTPQGTFTKAVVMDKTDDYIQIKVGKETDVNFRITGIREGYEDKQVVRPKKE